MGEDCIFYADIEGQVPTKEQKEILNLTSNAPHLSIRSKVYDKSGKVVKYTKYFSEQILWSIVSSGPYNTFKKRRFGHGRKNVTIVNKTGLHARPANGLVNLVKKYASRISLIKENKTANAKSIINVLTLDLNQGAQVLVRADGEDEEEALEAVVTYLAELTE